MSLTLDLPDELVERIAERAADLVLEKMRAEQAAPSQLVDAQTVADALGVSRDYIYDHADELGGVKVGNGDRPRWRFNLADALVAWQPAEPPTRTAPRRRRSPNGRSNLLPIHGAER
jgi:hypothetical protein